MEPLEERIKRLEFYHGILLKMVNPEDYPFYKLVMENELTEEEVMEIFALCEEIEHELQEQIEAEYVYHTSLLVHFVGMLNSKLEPLRVIQAMKKQGLYSPLMEKLEDIILKNLE